MTLPALALAFFDPAHGLHGQLRAGATLLFEGEQARTLAGAELGPRNGGWRGALAGELELAFEPTIEAVELGIASATVCRVSGKLGKRSIDCLGTATEVADPPRWDELESLRALCALFGPDEALFATMRRPRGAEGHGDELVRAVLIEGGETQPAEEARVSTTYDREGRQLSAGVELLLPGGEFPRRAFGAAAAGTSLELEGLEVHTAVFRWRMEGHEGAGAYDLTTRSEPPAAA